MNLTNKNADFSSVYRLDNNNSGKTCEKMLMVELANTTFQKKVW